MGDCTRAAIVLLLALPSFAQSNWREFGQDPDDDVMATWDSGVVLSDGCRSRSHPKFPDDVVWCEIDNGSTRARMYVTETRIIQVTAAEQPLAPAIPIRFYHELCYACENREDRLAYIAEVIAVDEGENDTLRHIVQDAQAVERMWDVALLASAINAKVRVTIRTDLAGKRNIHGKFRDPIVRLSLLNP